MPPLLLDTHLLLWALAEPTRLGKHLRRQLDASDVYVSAASIWEIAIKAALGKVDADPQLVDAAIEPTGFLPLPITGAHAAAVGLLPPHHRDPFDRLLIAQARSEGLRLVTNDAALRVYGPPVEVVR